MVSKEKTKNIKNLTVIYQSIRVFKKMINNFLQTSMMTP